MNNAAIKVIHDELAELTNRLNFNLQVYYEFKAEIKTVTDKKRIKYLKSAIKHTNEYANQLASQKILLRKVLTKLEGDVK